MSVSDEFLRTRVLKKISSLYIVHIPYLWYTNEELKSYFKACKISVVANDLFVMLITRSYLLSINYSKFHRQFCVKNTYVRLIR